LWKSTDGGDNWSSTGGACFNYTFYDIEVSPSDSNNLFVSAYYGIYHSPDGGSTWNGVGGLTSSTNSVAIDPASSNVVFAGTQGGGVFRSTDAAGSWASRSNGLTAVGTGQLALARSNPNTVLATGGGGIFKTADSGGHWSPISPGTSPVYSLAIDPLIADIIYAGGNYGPSLAGVRKTIDGGLNWGQAAHDPYPNVFALAIAPSNSNVIYAGSGGGGAGTTGMVARTLDGGASWPYVGQLSSNASNLAVDWSDPNTVYAVSGGGLLKSTDGGVTWNPINTGLLGVRSITVDPNNSQVLYTGATGGVFKSSNAGQGWNLTSLNKATNSVVAVRGDSNKLYAGTAGFGVYQSTDAGATWVVLNAGLTNLNVNSLAIDDTGRYLHASTSAGVFDYEYAPIAPASHFSVTAPQITTAGNNLPVTVTALDASNQKDINYSGTVHFSSSDQAAGLPSDYTFVVKPNQQAASGNSILIQQDFNPLAVSGIDQQILTSAAMTINSITVQFNNTFPKNGYVYMDLVKDDGAGNPSNSTADIIATSTNVNNAGGNGNFTFTFSPVTIPAGSFHIVVRTQHIASNGYSILSLNTSTRSTMAGLGAATIQDPSTSAWSTATPTQYMTFSINDPVFGDAGQHVFNAVLKTVGVQSISANDIATPTITGAQSGIVVQPNISAGSLTVSGYPSAISAGASGGFTVTVRDGYGNLDTGYKGTIHFTSSDSQATLPADYSFARSIDQTNTGSSILIQQDFNPLAVSGIAQQLSTNTALTIDSVTVQFDNSFPKNGYAYMDLVKDDGTGKPSNSAADILSTSSNVNGGGGAGSFTFNFRAITVPAGTFHLVVRTQNISSNGYSIFSEITGSSSTLPGLSPVMVQNPATGQWSNAIPSQYMYFSIVGG
ncbi:MAG: WD40/YVTN/BNR-like repeat-containing protein, partial [Limisphaerales bacterium]